MSVKNISFVLFLLAASLITACDRPECKNTDPIFDRYTPDTKEYKIELEKQMKSIGFENLDYWFDKSFEQKNREFYELYVQGDGLCAKMIVENRMKGRKLSNGGFRGAELKGLIIKIEYDSMTTNFVLEQIGDIID